MDRNLKRMKKSKKHEGLVTKYVKKTLAADMKAADICSTTHATHGVYEVFLYGNSYTVNLRQQVCSCRKYQIIGIPWEHAYGAIIYASLEVDDYVSSWFSKEMWEINYQTNMESVRGPRFWMKKTDSLVVERPKPDLPGRKKKSKSINKRIKGKHDSPKKKSKQVQKLLRTGGIIHCSNYGQEGHN